MTLQNCLSFSDQLSRLHMILKPFMLRRIKKDVENELSDKVCCLDPQNDNDDNNKLPLLVGFFKQVSLVTRVSGFNCFCFRNEWTKIVPLQCLFYQVVLEYSFACYLILENNYFEHRNILTRVVSTRQVFHTF